MFKADALIFIHRTYQRIHVLHNIRWTDQNELLVQQKQWKNSSQKSLIIQPFCL